MVQDGPAGRVAGVSPKKGIHEPQLVELPPVAPFSSLLSMFSVGYLCLARFGPPMAQNGPPLGPKWSMDLFYSSTSDREDQTAPNLTFIVWPFLPTMKL